ncbi:ATP-binding protein [Streptomyces fulvorobeus]|uniref:ATP-binding protein n=1 Tax=Streptomyces fulvorobeus TaxID=284028 RepID=A0A7J0C5D8_9ACTN|nr:ATP-binding protein [Streptomyces fulvorobeus]NYE41255.1 anti-sigma regulatory factor (Ser/Thr protein kinase) [Streptomyces fulvorobeus]GFM97598.1 ATP-binding protein [Streptomyces fulvorobeus]
MSLSQQRRFPRRRTSVGASRDFVVGVLTEWQFSYLIDDIQLCVSELATNALLHGVPPGRDFAVSLRTTDQLVRLEVRDSGSGLPVVQCPEEESCAGRGLYLVRALASGFGVDHDVVGKTVWAVFTKPAPP